MRKLAIIALALIGLASCKKQEAVEPIIQTVTVTRVDTFHTPPTTITVIVHDTVEVSPRGLIGTWKCYKMGSFSDPSHGSYESSDKWTFTFTSTELWQDLDGDNAYEFQYSVTYGNNYVDVIHAPKNSTYVITISGSEYILTRADAGGGYQSWYLRK